MDKTVLELLVNKKLREGIWKTDRDLETDILQVEHTIYGKPQHDVKRLIWKLSCLKLALKVLPDDENLQKMYADTDEMCRYIDENLL